MKKEKRNLIITEIVMVAIAIIWFIPIYYLIVTTLKGSQEATLNPLGLPRELRLDNYVNAWINMEFPRAFGNTFFITATAVLLIVIFGSMAGYALARTKSKMGTRLFLLFLAGLIVPFQMNIVSLYKIVKSFGIMNTLWSVILVDVAINTPQAVFLFKEFIESTVPKELEENDVILQEVTRNIGQFATDWTALFPMLMLGVAPLMIFYVFMQKYIIAGVAAGAVKG